MKNPAPTTFDQPQLSNPAAPVFQAQRDALEKELAIRLGADRVLAVNSAEAALQLLLDWLGVGRGDEVILSACNPPGIANAIIRQGAKPVLADTLPDVPLIDPEKVRRAISERTRMVIATNILGNGCNFEALQMVVNNARVQDVFIPRTIPQQRLARVLLVAFDPQSPGCASADTEVTRSFDMKISQFTPQGAFNMADGAALGFRLPLEFRPEELYAYFSTAANGGYTGYANREQSDDLSEPGIEALMSPSQIAATQALIKDFDQKIAPSRIELFEKYRFIFEKNPEVIVNGTAGPDSGIFSFSLPKMDPSDLMTLVKILRRRGFPIRFLYKPLPKLTWYSENGYELRDFPNADKHYFRHLLLPTVGVTPAMIVEFVDVLGEECKGIFS